jgi:hypothetical protein
MEQTVWRPTSTSTPAPRFLALDLQRQLLPGSFEYALNRLIEFELDLSGFDARFKHDETGAAAYPPAMLLKVVLFAYSQGIEAVCHVTLIVLSGGVKSPAANRSPAPVPTLIIRPLNLKPPPSHTRTPSRNRSEDIFPRKRMNPISAIQA